MSEETETKETEPMTTARVAVEMWRESGKSDKALITLIAMLIESAATEAKLGKAAEEFMDGMEAA